MHGDRLSMTETDYLTQSPHWQQKHEWVDGVAWAMTDGGLRHQAVATNAVIALAAALRGGPCRALNSDQRVHVAEVGSYFYPDALVVCGPLLTPPQDRHSIINPSVIVEVLSPTTRDYDLGSKFDAYRRLDVVRDVLYVEPERRHVTHFTRTAEGWLRRDLASGTIRLAIEGGVELPIESLYLDLDNVPPEPHAR